MQLKVFFKTVTCAKPASSRNSSVEAFVVCEGFSLPEGYIPSMEPLLDYPAIDYEGQFKEIVPFVACGDLSGYDSDMTYEASDNFNLDPIQEPIKPPYMKAIEMKRKNLIQRM